MPLRLACHIAFAVLILSNPLLYASADAPVDADLVFKNGTLVDGTGAARRQADVAIKGQRVVAVGKFTWGPRARVAEISGLVIAPGFIDLHTHSDESIIATRTVHNFNYQTQGVTTIVTGNCGGGAVDVKKYLDTIDRKGAGSNVIHLVPLGSVREKVMGNEDRKPTSGELDRMAAIVERGMKAGAWGVSTGLIYVPGRYAETSELTALTKVAARFGGLYASHIRDEGAGLLGAIGEAMSIGRDAGVRVHISHLKATGKANWGLVIPACERILEARMTGLEVTADQYPYTASSTKLAAMVVPHWAIQGDEALFARIADDPARGGRLRSAIQAELDERDGGATLRVARYHPRPEWVGRDLLSIARAEGTTPVELVIDIQRHGGAQAISFGMDETDVRNVMRQEFVATASDGSAHAPNGDDKPHPRAYGTFPRKIRYALDNEVITLEQAIRSCTSLPASILRLPDRGVIRPGAIADLVVFDQNHFRDAATFDNPTRYTSGVHFLLINGVATIDDGKPKPSLPGRALRNQKDGPADLVVKAGRIWTGDTEAPWATAIASRAGEIVAIGDDEDVAPFVAPTTRQLDRPAAFAMPGLIDAHGHVAGLGAGIEQIDLRGVASLVKVAELVKERVKKAKPGTWLTGRSWDQSLWPGGKFPTAAVLDAVAPDRPVWLRRVDGHAGWANSEAMRLAGVTRATKAPSHGQIIGDEKGEPTGVFVDGAMGLIDERVPPPTKDDLERAILEAQKLILDSGLTGVHDAGIGPLEAQAYRDLDRAGKLKLRVYAMASLPEGAEVEFVRKSPIQSGSEDRFRMRAVKAFMDGAMGSRGALLFDPYSDDATNTGLRLIDPARLERVATEALRHGWQVCTHAIGDRGNALVLDAYEKALAKVPTAKDARLRVEHAQVVRRVDVDRFRSLGVIASMQPSHAVDDMRWTEARLGAKRAEGAYAWKWFLDANVPLAFGSDFPVSVVSPYYGIYCAVTRQDSKGQPPGGWHADQKLSVEEALRAFTATAAFAGFDGQKTGILRVGMRADLTVVDRDLFKVPPLEILGAKTIATVVDGEIVGGEEAAKK